MTTDRAWYSAFVNWCVERSGFEGTDSAFLKQKKKTDARRDLEKAIQLDASSRCIRRVFEVGWETLKHFGICILPQNIRDNF